MLSFSDYITEGVNDPSIFKAVFLAGGPGSGKSFMVGKTALTALGFKLINSDPAFEAALKKAGLTTSADDIASPKGQELRGKSKVLVGKQLDLAIDGRLGLVIDGTGKDFGKIKQQGDALRAIGYSVAMIFVNTDLETALARNSNRDRSLPDDMVSKMWKDVQNNIGKFSNYFGTTFIVLDNSDGSNAEGAAMGAYKKIKAWAKKTPTENPRVKKWIDRQRGL
jgi:predicted kinase|tara:strand:+ start:143 stop:811 length:669 start_codon:yes stop_codon:yes gene_type:complete